MGHLTDNPAKTFFEGSIGDVMRTPWVRPQSPSHGCPLNFRLGRPLDVISELPWDGNSTFRKRPGDVGEGRTRDFLGTNICRLGPFKVTKTFLNLSLGRYLLNDRYLLVPTRINLHKIN